MTDVVVRVDNLGKKFRRGARPAYGRLSELLVNGARKGIGWAKNRAVGLISPGHGPSAPLDEHEFWALQDVSFEVERGEVLGIIGRNGAGKSTLLKLLSRITGPTTGEIRLRGRVGSLLEVGTGFHPELTGRENIYLNGTILGMGKAEIDRKFEEIVAFAEIEQFLDTPVKHYSSGMYMRLAFAVAAHLDPEILIVDEVLAVGDAGFQKKCLGKMGEVAERGKTALFVSHNMAAVESLCQRALLLSSGTMTFYGGTREAICEYQRQQAAVSALSGISAFVNRENRYRQGDLIIVGASLKNLHGDPTDAFPMGGGMLLDIHLRGLPRYRSPQAGIVIRGDYGTQLACFHTGMQPPCNPIGQQQDELLSLRIERLPLIPGNYQIDISVAQHGVERLDYVDRAFTFQVEDSDIYGTGYAPRAGTGVVYLEGDWEVKYAPRK